jgi:hypothetical protein
MLLRPWLQTKSQNTCLRQWHFVEKEGILGNSNIDKREWGLEKEKSRDGTLCYHVPCRLMHSGKCLSAFLLFICLFFSKFLCLSSNIYYTFVSN